MKIFPTHDRVLVRPIEQRETESGIILPASAKEKPVRGKVIAVGPGRMSESGARIPTGFSIGDEVMFSKYAGTEIEGNRQKYLLMNEQEIQCIIVEGDA